MNIETRVTQYEYGWYIELFIDKQNGVQLSYCTDKSICLLIDVRLEDYKGMLKSNGAVDTANGITYFSNINDAYATMPLVQQIITEFKATGYLGSNFIKNLKKEFTVLDF